MQEQVTAQAKLVECRKKLLIIHCEYLQKAGEDMVVSEETALLEPHYQVLRLVCSNEELLKLRRPQQLAKTIWNREFCQELRQFLQQHQPDIIHVHNTFPLFSPAIFRVLGRWKRRCLKQGQQRRIILTLHNFRLHCPQASLMRPQYRLLPSQKPEIGSTLCQRCFRMRSFWPAILSRCYRGSFAMTLAVATMLALHKWLRTWHSNVDKFIYLNAAQRTLLGRVGFPTQKFVHKPNFLSPQDVSADLSLAQGRSGGPELGTTVRLLFAGRLSEEKGLRILLNSIRCLAGGGGCEPNQQGVSRNIELRIAGAGPLQAELQKELQDFTSRYGSDGLSVQQESKFRIEYLGKLDRKALQFQMQQAHFLVLPSIWYEGMPMTLLESLAAGRPVVSFRLGASAEVLRHQENGILLPFFRNAIAQEQLLLNQSYSHSELTGHLAAAIAAVSAIEQECYDEMCRMALASFSENYTAQRNLSLLRNIYEA